MKKETESEEASKNDLDIFTERLIEAMQNPSFPDEGLKMLGRYYSAVSALNNYSERNISFLLNQADNRNMDIAFNKREEEGITINQVKPYRKWKALDVQVKRGEKSLEIYAPSQKYKIRRDANNKPIKSKSGRWDYELDKEGKKIKSGITFLKVPVFNSDQTDAEEKGVIKKVELSDNNGEISDKLLNSFIEKISKNFNIPIQQTILSANLGGFYMPEQHEITLNSSRNNKDQLKVLFHELGHSILHKGEDSRKISTGIKEAEAESVSFILSSKLGIEGGSDFYIKGYGNDTDTVKERLSRIVGASKEVFKLVDFEELINQEEQRLSLLQEVDTNDELFDKWTDEIYEKNEEISSIENLDFLMLDRPYFINDNEAVMMALTGGTIETVKEDGWKIFRGEQGNMKPIEDLTELEALNIVNEARKESREKIYEEFHTVFMGDKEDFAEALLGYSNAKLDFFTEWQEKNETLLMAEMKERDNNLLNKWKDPFKELKTEDSQRRKGGYPKSGKPDTIEIDDIGDNITIEYSFKNTSESEGIAWVQKNLELVEGLELDLSAYQDGDYQDDWIGVIAVVKNTHLNKDEDTFCSEALSLLDNEETKTSTKRNKR